MNRALVTVAPGAEEAHLRLGESLWRGTGLPEAAEAYREAVKLHPEYAQAHVMLGLTLASLGQIEEAAEAFRGSARHPPPTTLRRTST